MELVVQNQIPIHTPLIEREEHDHILNLAILTKEHVLFSGKPGTAKSLQASTFFANFNASIFSVQLSKFSTEDVLFGPLNISKLREGFLEYMYQNTILTANFAFIDEIFDASDAVLRSLLGVLNERHFSKGQFQKDVPLITTVATANYTRVNEVTEAILDRFLLQYYVEPVQDKQKLLNFALPEIISNIGLDSLKNMQDQVNIICFPAELMHIYIKIGTTYGFSDRRLSKGIKVLKANALLRSSKYVEAEDFIVLKYLIGVEKAKIIEAETMIKELVANSKIRTEQLLYLSNFKQKWHSIIHNHDCKNHLLIELNMLKELKRFRAIDDIITREKDSLFQECWRHYEPNRKAYIEKLNVREFLNEGDF